MADTQTMLIKVHLHQNVFDFVFCLRFRFFWFVCVVGTMVGPIFLERWIEIAYSWANEGDRRHMKQIDKLFN